MLYIWREQVLMRPMFLANFIPHSENIERFDIVVSKVRLRLSS
jgi:hypothetical protein